MRTTILALALAAVLAGCGQSASQSTEPMQSPAGAQPAGVQPAAAVAAGDPMEIGTCDDGQSAVASFRPQHDAAWYRANDPAVRRITGRQRLIVGTSGDVLLWGARNPFTGKLDGFDTQLLNRIAGTLGVEVEYKVINYGQRIPSLVSDDPATSVDIVAHTMTINCTRWKDISFSTEYYRAGQRILVRFDPLANRGKGAPLQTRLQGLQGKSVCVAKGSTNIDTLNDLNAAQNLNITVVGVSDLGDCLVKFQQGAVDAITGDDTVLAGFAAQDRYATVAGPALSVEPYGLGFKQADRGFTEYVNALLDQWRADGTLRAIYQDTMGKAVEQAPVFPAPDYGRTQTL